MGNFLDAINPIGAAVDTIANPLFAHLTNVKNRQFTREMYGRQREDALADWRMNNQYNSPREQMQRFQEAGLNPNLIYGQMTEASPVRASSSSGGQASAPQTDVQKGFMGIYQAQQLKAQTDLTQKQLDNVAADVELKKVQAMATIIGTAKTEAERDKIRQDIYQSSELFAGSMKGQQLTNQLKQQEIVINWARNNREAAMNAKSLEQITQSILQSQSNVKLNDEQIAKIKEEVNNLRKEGRIKELDAKLADSGVRPGDSALMREIAPLIHEIILQLKKDIPNAADTLEEAQQKGPRSLEAYRKRHAIGKHQ